MKDDTHAKADHDDASNGNGKRKNGGGSEGTRPPMKRSEYEDALVPLQEELVKLQQWVVAKQKKVCIVLEGRDTAGKGGTIKAITDRVSPRVFRVVALPTPTDRERTQMYMQRYVAHLPSGGEVAIFDRSWYNRAGVERVMGFATDAQVRKFLETAPLLEKTMVASGVHLLKYWLEVSEEEQIERLKSRATDGRKLWKLSPMDLKSYGRWFDYSRARDAMFEATDTEHAPWYVANTDDKRRGRLNIIRHLLANVPYDEVEREKVQFPKRQKRGDYVESRHPLHFIEQRY